MSDRVLEQSLWALFDSVRGSLREYDVFLFLFVLVIKGDVKDEWKDEDFDIDKFFGSMIENLSMNEKEIFEEAYDLFWGDLNQIEEEALNDVIFILNGIKANNYKNKLNALGKIFDDILYKVVVSNRMERGEAIQPNEITEVMVHIANPKKGDFIFNPFAGLASFYVDLLDGVKYFGQEINHRTFVLGQLRLLAYDKYGDASYGNEDSILNWPNDENEFDTVIASLPFNLRINKTRYPGIESNTVAHFFIERSIDLLKKDGKAIALVSNGFLSRSGREKDLRKQLINNDMIETIISLPGNLMFNTAIPTNILVLNEQKETSGAIRMIDANEMVVQTSRVDYKLKVNQLVSVYDSQQESKENRLVSNSEIKKNDYNLTVPRYFINNVTDKIDGVRLSDILKQVKGERVRDLDKGRYLKIGDLNDYEMGVYADIENVELSEINRGGYKVSKPVLMLATRFKNLKPTILESGFDSLVISNDITSFEVNEGKVDLGYLVFELRKEYVQNQVEKYQSGTAMPYLSVEDLLRIEIKLPPKKVQRQKLLDEISHRTKEELNKYSKELSGMKTDLFREFSSTRHLVKQYLNGIRSGVNGLKKYLTMNDGNVISLTDTYSVNLGNTLEEHLEGIIENTKEASEKLDKLETPFLSGTKEKLNLIDLTKEAMKKVRGSKDFEYDELNIDRDSFSTEDGDEIEPVIEINRDDYFKLFRNIIENACDHGFEEGRNNIVRIYVTFLIDSKQVQIEIANNGEPFDSKFSIERLKIRGEKSVSSDSTGNSGTGGADIDQIVKMYGGTFDLELIEDNEFPVNYKLQFPIKIEGVI